MRRIFACAALAAASIAFVIGAAQGQGKPRIILYQEDNYRGAHLEVDGEVARVKQLHFDDRVSSVRVISGTWELCGDDAFRGQCVTVRRDEPRLDRLGLDDMVSSLRPVADRRDARNATVQGGFERRFSQEEGDLGQVWDEKEAGWQGVWTRRGHSNIFDARWTHPGERPESAVLIISVRGGDVRVQRDQGRRGTCTYSGTIDRGRNVRGSYSCTWAPGSQPWSARISD